MTEITNMPLQAGTMAPDFALDSTSGSPVTLSSFRGEKNVLLAFFPLAFTSTCTKQLCSFSEDFDQFTDKGVVVLPISVDATPSLKEFKKAYALKEELLSDFKRQASRAYGVLSEENYYSERAYFLIDKAGVIRWSFVEPLRRDHRENAELLAEIAKMTD
ncbi:MAG: redoxin domain-containing protein [Gemmatimonadaceae bacterium]